MRWLANTRYHEGRQRYGNRVRQALQIKILTDGIEFSGTLLGFDDFVSE